MILGYVRVSSADQAKDDRSSLQTQTAIIEGFAQTRGATKFDIQVYSDAGVSGAVKLAARPAGAQLLADMKPGDVVVASKLDRMFRSTSDALAMLDEFKKRQVDLVLFDIMGGAPLTGGVAELVFTILAAVASMERQRIAERTAEGRKAKKARGGAVGEVPFGYRKVGEGRSATLEPNEREIAAQARMKVWAAQYKPLRQISKQLAAEGFLSRAGTPYSPEAIRRMTA